jgi:hypothetical protein
MAVANLVANFVNGELVVMRGDRHVLHQPFRPAIGDDPIRPWTDENDALTYWTSIQDEWQMNGLTTEEIQELSEEQ